MDFWLLFAIILNTQLVQLRHFILSFNPTNMNNFSPSLSNITDENLYVLCKQYGEKARLWRQKFIGMLPEVHKRKLYEKKGFGSIFEFAAKLCGLSEEQVRTALNLEQSFSDKPLLKSLLQNGEVSINKLIRIQSVATSENQAFWANQVQILPQKALETLVRDERKIPNPEKDFLMPLPFEGKNELHAHSVASLVEPINKQICSPNLSNTVQERLLKLQEKGIDINELLTKLLDQHEEAIQAEKAQISKEMSEKVITKTSRYIPKKVLNILKKEHGDKCSIPTCTKPSEQKHHTQRFSLISQFAPNLANDPKYLAPLCKNHHHIAHSIDIQYHEVRQKIRSR